MTDTRKAMTNQPLKVVSLNADQESLSVALMDAIRETIRQSRFDSMTVATTIGVLEMLKYEQIEWSKT